MFYPDYDVSRLVGAMYNPRQINKESLEKLQGSIRDIGMVVLTPKSCTRG